MAGKTKPKKKQPLDMRSKMYLVLALCSVMLLVCIGISPPSASLFAIFT